MNSESISIRLYLGGDPVKNIEEIPKTIQKTTCELVSVKTLEAIYLKTKICSHLREALENFPIGFPYGILEERTR